MPYGGLTIGSPSTFNPLLGGRPPATYLGELLRASNASCALEALNIKEIPFEHVNGNCLGFARERSIFINPVNPMPHKTRFHELAHVLLGHSAEGQQADSEITPRNQRECEAELVALLCCAALDLPGVAECRGYIQNWWGQGNPIPERSAQKILKTADQILKAGGRS